MMFRKITALVFFIMFVTQTFSAPLIMLNYYTNSSAYAKNCINKSRPKMHCNGKCQMMKKIKEEEKKEQESAEKRGNVKSEALSSKSFYPALLIPESIHLPAVKIAEPYNIVLTDPSYDFFHPPQLAIL